MKNAFFLCLLTVFCSILIPGKCLTIEKAGSVIAFKVAEKDLFPEGIAYDSKTDQFFLGSILKKKIIAVGKNGSESDFAQSGQDGLSECLGLKVDVQRRRLWALSYEGKWSGDKTAYVHIFDIDSKKLVKKLSAEKGKFPAFNDLVLTDDGGAYITDYIGNAVYYVNPALEKLELFVSSEELLRGANGIQISADKSFLYVASETQGIVMLDLATKKIEPIANHLGINSKVIDGLMYYKNSLIAILNPGFDPKFHCIVRYYLSGDGKEIIGASIMDRNNPLFEMPTTGVIAGDNFYCLAATLLDQLTVDYKYDITKIKNPLVLKYHLD